MRMERPAAELTVTELIEEYMTSHWRKCPASYLRCPCELCSRARTLLVQLGKMMLLGLVILAAGCASAPKPMVMAKDGATQEGFAQDKLECIERASFMRTRNTAGIGGGPYLIYGASNESAYLDADPTIFRLCMEARGYQVQAPR
jgi:hypothetical protein